MGPNVRFNTGLKNKTYIKLLYFSFISIRSQRMMRVSNYITFSSNMELILQDAQLSQRDRAAQFSPKVEEWNWKTIFYGRYRSIFNHCDIIDLKICRIL